MTLSAKQIIGLLCLTPLAGEGGYYAETYRGADTFAGAALPERYGGGTRSSGTAIYYLLTEEPDSFSALHRLRGDEVYHFYMGDAVEMLLLEADGSSRLVRLGQDLAGGEQVQALVPAGAWQGSRLAAGGRWALLGTTMAPGFDLADFELGRREELLRLYPSQTKRIHDLTRA